MIKKYFRYGLLIIFLACAFSLKAQEKKDNQNSVPLTRILFVFDGSQSMYAHWQSDIKFNIARKLLSKILDSLRKVDNLELALRIYGHQMQYPPQVCNDTKLEVPFGRNNIDQIKHRLNSITPKGTTPIAYALEQAGKDFTPCADCRNIIVLITDGIEECGGDPCEVSRRLQKKGLILKPFIVGIGRNIEENFKCAGTYFDATSEDQFRMALNVVISHALNTTTLQVNLLDENNKPTETNVNMTFYDSFSGLQKYNFIHTLNNKGIPDTISIDPIPVYNLVVHTIPPVRVSNIKLSTGMHNIIPVSAPQGFLRLKVSGGSSSIRDLLCIVRKDGNMETVNIQNFESREKYLTGKYDLEVLCLPRIYIDDVEIRQSHTTTIEIPTPGIAVIKKTTSGYGSLYQVRDKELKWIYNFRDDDFQQETLFLQPGNYKVVFRSKYSDKSIYTLEKSFVVESGKTSNVKLYSN